MKISIDVEDGYEGRFHYLRDIAGLLGDAGVEIAFNDPIHDALIIQGSILTERERASGKVTDTPLLIYERTASGAINAKSHVRRLIQRPNVRAWLKETSFRDPDLYNEPVITHRRHVSVMARSIDDPSVQDEVTPLIAIGPEEAAKIVAAPPVHLQGRYERFKSLPRRQFKTRKVDICCAGTVEYGTGLLSIHRYRASQEILKLQSRATIIGTGRVFPGSDFPLIMQSSKIFVSPYGYGEYSFKDFEAIFAGCVLIKPPISHVRTGLFDIYDGQKHHLETDVWFSDLEEVAQQVFDNEREFDDRAEQSRRSLLASIRPEAVATDFLAWLDRVLDRNPSNSSTDAQPEVSHD